MPEVYLVGGVRTPQGKYGGALAAARPDDLAALVVREAVSRSGAPAEAIEEVVLGAANQAGEDNRNVVTAGSSSPLSDGAAALVVASEAAVERYGLAPRARVVTGAAAGVAPQLMGLGPVPATEKALARAGWGIGDLDAVELNEAFAVQSLAVIRRLKLDEERVNADGGAIALGHPLGCSGARITVTLLGRMEREGARRGLATLCVGVGQGAAMLLEQP
ncbi:thiolase family protein [Paractinoplanes rhizophilus]|uniref:Probable acetyl-CoA acetyltransferase n=1 Tax=Paractinoplanes rhizophilus TaxID=1416877 RepID=A0ABW2HYV0_9ACTN